MRAMLKAAVLSVLTLSVPAQAAPATIGALDKALAAAFRDANIPGGAVAIVERGQIVFAKGYGFADVAKKIPATPDTLFRAGSISKSFTSIAVMTGVERGVLSLDDRLAVDLPDVKIFNPWESMAPLRIADLLEHSTGWPDAPLRLYGIDAKGWPLKRSVELASAHFVSRWQPGLFGVYNNAGPVVAAYALEKRSGEDFAAYMRERVLRPMGMLTADFRALTPSPQIVAKSYGPDGSETPHLNPVLWPAASLTTNVKELAQLVRLYLARGTVDGKTILSPASVERIEHSETTLASRAGLDNGYGLGNVALSDSGTAFRGHNGSIDSFTSVYGYSRKEDAGYVLLANGGDGVNYGTAISELIQGYLAHGRKTDLPPAYRVADPVLASYAGFYRAVTPPSNFLRPFVEVLSGVTRVSAGHGRLTIGSDIYVPTGPRTFRRLDRDDANVAFAEQDGRMYKLGYLNAQVKVPLWWLVSVFVVVGLLAIGLLVSLAMIPVWIVAAIRRRFALRGTLLLPALPFASLIAMAATLGAPILAFNVYGAGPALATLGHANVYTVSAFVCSLLFPTFAIAGLWFAVRSDDIWRIVRIYVGAVSVALLTASIYAASIGWIGARIWAM